MANSSIAVTPLEDNKIRNRNFLVTGGLLTAYFLIRMYLSAQHFTDTAVPKWLESGTAMLMLSIIGSLLWVNRKDLSRFNFDHSAVVVFFLFATLLRIRRIDTNISLVFEAIFFLVAVAIFITFLIGRPNLEKRPILNKWFLIAIISGFLYAIVMLALNPIKHIPSGNVNSSTMLYYFLYYVHFGISTAGVLEEPIYRGFLFGFLRYLGLNDYQTILAQGFFFWVSHFNLVNSPFTFWLALPIMCLLLGFLAYKSRSVVPPMIAHVIYNAYEVMHSQL